MKSAVKFSERLQTWDIRNSLGITVGKRISDNATTQLQLSMLTKHRRHSLKTISKKFVITAFSRNTAVLNHAKEDSNHKNGHTYKFKQNISKNVP
jgi:hypothetical protein